MVTPVTRSRSTSPQSSTASSRCDGRQAIAPPPVSAPSAVNWAVACISGAAASTSRMHRALVASAAPGALAGLGGRLQRRQALEQVAAAAQHLEQVLLAPHHPLGHAGGAAGVHEQQVVARAAPGRDHAALACARRSPHSHPPSPGPGGRARPTAIQRLHLRQAARGPCRRPRRRRRGRPPPRRRRCRTGRRARRRRSGSWC